jgi:hypothetical protein
MQVNQGINMKAWRKEAEKINARRKAGSKEPRARAQMQAKKLMPTIKGCGSNLLWYILVLSGYIANEMEAAVNHINERAARIEQVSTKPEGKVKKFLKWLGSKIA